MLITLSKSRFNTFVNISRVQTKDEKDFHFHLRMPARHATTISLRIFSLGWMEMHFCRDFHRNDFPNNRVSAKHRQKNKIFGFSSDQNRRIKLLVSKSKAINKIRCFIFAFNLSNYSLAVSFHLFCLLPFRVYVDSVSGTRLEIDICDSWDDFQNVIVLQINLWEYNKAVWWIVYLLHHMWQL